MPSHHLLESYITPLLSGNRVACRTMVMQEASRSKDVRPLFHDLLWPAMERVEALFRGDRINTAAEHMATRINRTIADQLQGHLTQRDRIGKSIVITCADGEPEELGAQMCADLFEARGWEVYFLGSGVPNDEIYTLIGQIRPSVLLIFGTQPQGVPGVRHMIDMIREIGVNPTMNIMVSGGVFNRADGLWKEVNADLTAKTAADAIPIAETAEPRIPVIPQPGAPKKRRRRRRAPVATAAE